MSEGNTRRKLDNAKTLVKEWHGGVSALNGWKFKARYRMRLSAVNYMCTTAGGTGTIYVVKKGAASTSDVNAATEMASLDATSTANTGATFTLSTTATDLVIEPGEWVGLYLNSVNTLLGAVVQPEFDPIP